MPKRVLVVDDSAFMRRIIGEILGASPDLQVVGTARDGAQAIEMLHELKPDVITLDIEMPTMSGEEALARIMKERPTPVVMLSSLTQAGADITVKCLQNGAIDYIGKPSGSTSLDIAKIGDEIRAKVVGAANAKLSHSRRTSQPKSSTVRAARLRALIIGSSTGGPRALQTVVPHLPADLGVPVVIVQHMPEHFTKSLADRLDNLSHISVCEAIEGDRLRPGLALLAPGGKHLKINSDGSVSMTNEPALHGVRPAIDITIGSAVQAFGGDVGAVILTGMGKDGAAGCRAVMARGGPTIAEHESTCAVYGMPRSVIEMNAAEYVLPLDEIAGAISALCKPQISRRVA
ncbi:MAG: chemotaxis response regulator protein-glutamate methylesterase [Fimbriimonadaceae bacterium]